MDEPPFRPIKGHIAGGIAQGVGASVRYLPSENALVPQFHVSRMTVNRAMRELANENLIRRVPGVGTFVAEPVSASSPRGNPQHRAEIFAREHRHRPSFEPWRRIEAPDDGARLSTRRRSQAVSLHDHALEDDIPLQLEDRFVDPALAPGYVHQDFTQTTPHEYLMRVAPLSARRNIWCRRLQHLTKLPCCFRLAVGEPCLLVSRRTWVGTQPASRALLYHPGSRFRLGGPVRQSCRSGTGNTMNDRFSNSRCRQGGSRARR